MCVNDNILFNYDIIQTSRPRQHTNINVRSSINAMYVFVFVSCSHFLILCAVFEKFRRSIDLVIKKMFPIHVRNENEEKEFGEKLNNVFQPAIYRPIMSFIYFINQFIPKFFFSFLCCSGLPFPLCWLIIYNLIG